MRLGLLMRRMALDWTLSRRQRVDFGAPTLERSQAEMFLWSWISVEAWSFGLNENEELRKVSSAKE